MSYFHSDPERGVDAHATEDMEVFFVSASDFLNAGPDTWQSIELEAWNANEIATTGSEAAWEIAANALEGWYYWPCFPGCLPDGNAVGPFQTEDEAVFDAQEMNSTL